MVPVLGAILLGLLGFLAIRIFAWTQVFQPTRRMSRDPSSLGVDFRSVSYLAEDGASGTGWWIPCENPIGTLIVLHGSGGNLADRIDMLAAMRNLRVHLFAIDYRGYGRSRGIPSEQGLIRDVRAAYEVVRAEYDDADDPPVAVYGRSLGGLFAVHLAAQKPVRGLIVEAAFTSFEGMVRHRHPRLARWYRLAGFRLNAVDEIRKVTCPTLVAHSVDDDLIPFVMGCALAEAAPQAGRCVSLKGTHDQVGWECTPEYYEQLAAFLRDVLGEDTMNICSSGQ